MASRSSSSESRPFNSEPSRLKNRDKNAFSRLRIRSSQLSVLARSCVVTTNKSKNKEIWGPGKATQKPSTVVKNVPIESKIREYKDVEPFYKSSGKMFCREELALKASIIKGHIDSSKHNAGKEMLAQVKKRDISILEAMKKSVVVI